MQTEDDQYRLMQGDCREILRTLEDESIQTCVTSPPYYGLRDYGVDGQIGIDQSPSEYVDQMVKVFSEVRRVLRDDGTLWLNLGDSYSNGGRVGGAEEGYKEKNLLGIPWRVAFALQADGWYLRQDIIWHKPNPMPEPVADRCTKSHEYIFLFSKSPRYYFDGEAISELAKDPFGFKYDGGYREMVDHSRNEGKRRPDGSFALNSRTKTGSVPHFSSKFGNKRNKRSVWTVNTSSYKGAHFATFPAKLIEPCILAGASNGSIVLDPFNGSGTTGAVALANHRKYIGIELNPAYLDLTQDRLRGIMSPLFDRIES